MNIEQFILIGYQVLPLQGMELHENNAKIFRKAYRKAKIWQYFDHKSKESILKAKNSRVYLKQERDCWRRHPNNI